MLASTQVAAGAPVRVAVLELGNPAELTDAEIAYLSDQVRTSMAATLPAESYLIMTRESIQELLPVGVSMKDCLDAVCEVEIGRTIGADFVVSGEVLLFADEYRLILKAHDCDTAAFLTSRTVGARALPDLEGLVPEAAGPVALRLKRSGSVVLPAPIVGEGGEVANNDWFLSLGETAVVNFESQPGGAAVWVDGRLVCSSTPCSREIPTGLVTITMERDRHRPRQDMVRIMPDSGAVVVAWDLTPDFGWLDLTEAPVGLMVEVDGVVHKAGGANPLELSTGYHALRVIDPRYHPAEGEVRIDPGGRHRLPLVLEPREGGLQLGAVDADSNAVIAMVRIDGRAAGQTPLAERLLIGPHLVEVRGDAGGWRGEVEILENETTTLKALLEADWRPGVAEGFVRIEPGQFLMGSPPYEKGRNRHEDRHQVTLTRPFMLGTTEVTQAQWREVMGTAPSQFGGEDHPVEQVDWYDAVRYCNALSRRAGLAPAYRIEGETVVWDRQADGYRLPTEAEWEYACRAGTITRYAAGDRNQDLLEMAIHRANAGGGTGPVANLHPNGWGLYDMHGNVWEWCWNWSADYPSRFVTDPIGPAGGRSRVIRGGAWDSPPASCRAAKHNAANPEMRAPMIGFRVARNAAEGFE
jgi:formylglycine-generating enzyme required for sulfatase activity